MRSISEMTAKKPQINMILLLTFLMGIVIALQIRTVSKSGGIIKFKSINELKKQVELEREANENLSQLLHEKKTELYHYTEELENTGSILELMEQEKKKRMTICAVTPLRGEGIVLRVSDSEDELKEGENPNDKIVHDQDVLHILNDLKIVGAEALSINGQRVSSLSEIKCAGPTITINEKTYGQPFMIYAIGPKEDLMDAIVDPESYTYLLRTVYGLEIEASVHDDLYVPGYGKYIELKYMKEAL